MSNDQVTGFTVANNILSQNGNALEFSAGVNVAFVAQPPRRCQQPHHGSTDATGSPLFIAPGSGNFHVQNGSPAIDRGGAAGAPATDYDSVARPQRTACDVGAYELP